MKRQPSKQKQLIAVLAKLDQATNDGYDKLNAIHERTATMLKKICEAGNGFEDLMNFIKREQLTDGEIDAVNSMLAGIAKACSGKGGVS